MSYLNNKIKVRATQIDDLTATVDELNALDGITATVAELNILDGVTATAAEINLIDGSVAGTAVASKALSLGSNKNVDVLAIADGGLKLGAGAGTAVTSTAAELNLLDGSVAGTAVASKALVLGSDKNVDVLAIADGGLKLGAGAGTAVTATAAELNQLDGVTSTAAELNATFLHLDIADGSAEAVYYVVSPHAGNITKIWTVIDGVVATADITITAAIGATPVTNGEVTIATAASAAGDVDSATPTAANAVTAGQAINFTVTGGGAGGTPRVHLVAVVERT